MKVSVLVGGGLVHLSLGVQEEVLLADVAGPGIHGNHRVAHLQHPGVHDVLHRRGQPQSGRGLVYGLVGPETEGEGQRGRGFLLGTTPEGAGPAD